MPEAAPKQGAGALGRKAGPFPIFVWALLAVAAYYAYTHYGPGKKAPPAETADTTELGSNEITTARFQDNAQWASAAIDYLSGIGVPRGQATTEVDNYLRGLPNTAQGRQDVQQARNALGPPPVTPPEPPQGPEPYGGPKPIPPGRVRAPKPPRPPVKPRKPPVNFKPHPPLRKQR